MKFKTTPWIAMAALYIGMAGNVLAVTVFTDRTAFEAALLSSTVEDFQSYPNYGTPDPYFNIPDGETYLDLNYFTLTAPQKTIKIWDQDHSGAHNTSAIGTKYLYLDTDIGLQGSTTDFLLDNPADAFGFDYTGVYEPGTDFTVTIGSNAFNLGLNNPEDTPLFWGVIGLGSFSTVTLATSLDSAYGVDEVTFGSAVPLPPALWLFGSGLMALAGGAVKRKTRGKTRPQ